MTGIEHTHSIEIIVKHRFGDREVVAASVLVAGYGDIDHMIDTFQTALVAAGFAPETAAKLGVRDE